MLVNKDIWSLLSDISATINKLLEHFHYHHPRASCSYLLIISHTLLTDLSISNFQTLMNSKQLLLSIPISSHYIALLYPPPFLNLVDTYILSIQIITHSSHIVYSTLRLNPHITVWINKDPCYTSLYYYCQ